MADNPVAFQYQVGGEGEVSEVVFRADGWPLHDDPIPVEPGTHSFSYDFYEANFERTVSLTAYDSQGESIDRDRVVFIPDEGWLPPEDGFNRYMVEAINDTSLYPKDGTYSYCLSNDCGEYWGMIQGGWYLGEQVFPGGEDCFCTGHALEIFLDAYERWQADNDVATGVAYGGLTMDSLDLGEFYQHWQGYGVASVASGANALESAGIGQVLYEDDWPEAVTGDVGNLSRSTGSGHAIIFVDWLWEAGELAGLRYYGCQGCGDSHPDPDDPDNISCVSGPAFVSEYFTDYGGTVLRSYLYLGHPFDPATL